MKNWPQFVDGTDIHPTLAGHEAIAEHIKEHMK